MPKSTIRLLCCVFAMVLPATAGGYFQTVPLRERSLVPGSVSFTLTHGGQALQLENGKDVAIDASRYELNETIEAELVFAGWGISAPAIGQDDYAGLNVKDKAVVILEGAPASFPGALRAHYVAAAERARGRRAWRGRPADAEVPGARALVALRARAQAEASAAARLERAWR